MTLLSVRDLTVSFGELEAVRGVSFDVDRGSRVGLVGESGAGKSLTALAVLGLLPEGANAKGRATFDGEELLTKSELELARIRGNRISIVFQDPMSALNPVMRVGSQVAAPLRLHRAMSRREAWRNSIDLLERVGLPSPAAKARAYPHELSGGQRQRVMIAAQIACNPEILIADEPTTALDVTIQAEILTLLGDLVKEEETALLLITHDLPVVASQCEEVIVLYGGRIMEHGTAQDVFASPQHPYSAGLVRSQPTARPTGGTTKKRLPVIPGVVPPLGQFPTGCPFRDRCEFADERCFDPPPREVNRTVHYCWNPLRAVA